MRKLDQRLTNKIAQLMPEKKRERILFAVESVNNCLKNKGWTPGVSKTANTALNKGLINAYISIKWDSDALNAQARALGRSLNYGYNEDGLIKEPDNVEKAWNYIQTWNEFPLKRTKITTADILLWIKFVDQYKSCTRYLNSLRPKPIITKIHLSPKVTKTLIEMNLDIAIHSIKMAELEEKEHHYVNEFGPQMDIYYIPKWSKGCKHNQSRFNQRQSQCQACGKTIPSGRFVALEAFDKKSQQTISLWTGIDCAKKIFGVQDIGIEKVPAPK